MNRLIEWRLEPSGLVILLLALVAFVIAGVNDPDWFWHLRAGQWIVEHHGLPTHDPFSFTRPDAAWVLHEWLFEVLLYGVHGVAGIVGVRTLVAACLGATFLVNYRTVRAYVSPALALWVGPVSCAVLLPFAAPRPQLLSFLFFATYLHQLLGFLRDGNPRRLYLLPALMLVWVNCHGAFVMGLVLIATAAAGVLADGRITRTASDRLRPLLICLGATAAASLVNPYHVHHWIYPFQTASMEAMASILEWQRPTMGALAPFLVLLLAWVGCLPFRNSRPALTELFLAAGMTLLALSAVRHLPLATLTFGPLLAIALADGVLSRLQAARWVEDLRSAYRRSVGQGKELGSGVYVLNWFALGVFGVAAFAVGPVLAARQKEGSNAIIGWKAVDFIEQHGITGRMFNEYGFGGLLIYRLYPAQQVFIDGRADAYGDAFVKEYLKISNGDEGWSEAFDTYAIDYVVCPRRRPIHQLLLQRGDFVSVYADADNAVLVRRGREAP